MKKNELHVFSGKAFCGMIQYKGALITFTEDIPMNKHVLQTLKNAVRDSGLKLSKSIILKSENKLVLDGLEISFHRERNGWRFRIDQREYTYQMTGTPGKEHPKELLSQRLQHYLYKNEKINPFCVTL